jgi:hypothetical protein
VTVAISEELGVAHYVQSVANVLCWPVAAVRPNIALNLRVSYTNEGVAAPGMSVHGGDETTPLTAIRCAVMVGLHQSLPDPELTVAGGRLIDG